MAYTPQTWSDSPATTTPISAARLAVMENGIQAAATATATGAETLTQKTIGDKLDFASVTPPAAPSVGTTRFFARTGVSGLDAPAWQNSLGLPMVIGRDIGFFAKNITGSTITKGSVVYIQSATASVVNIAKAQADAGGTKLPAVGILAADITNNSFGLVLQYGVVQNLNASTFTDGAILYVDATTPGALTATRPAHPSVGQMVGVCTNSSGSTGSILVTCTPQNTSLIQGTNGSTWGIGDGTGSGAKSVQFKNTNTGTLSWTPTAARTITLPDVTDTLVGKNTADTLTNKTLDNTTVETIRDTNLTIQRNADITQIAKFAVHPNGPNGTITITLPPANSVLLSDSGAQTGIANKTFNDDTNKWRDATDNTKQFRFDVPASQTTATSRVHTLPAVDSVLASLDGTETITGAKTFNAGTLLDKGSQVFNVKAYGAVGNGSTDDTTNIQAAINAANSAGGGVVFFPAGTYKITSALTVYTHVTLRGVGDGPLDGAGGSTTAAAVSAIKQATTTAHGLVATDAFDIGLENLAITGPGSGSGIGVNFGRSTNGDCRYMHFANVTVQDFGGDGINIDTPIVSRFDKVVSYSNGGHGFSIRASSTSAGTSCTFTSCWAHTNTGNGWNIDHLVYSSFVSCAADFNVIGYFITNCQGLAVTGSGAESNTGNGMKITGSYNVLVGGCWNFHNPSIAYYVTGNSVGISFLSCHENTPTGTPTASFQVDSGSNASINGYFIVTPMVLATGSTTILNDNAANVLAGGYVRGTDFELTNANGSFAVNAHYNSGWKYVGTGAAFLMNADGAGGMYFYTAPSGSAGGAVTFTERLHITTSGLQVPLTGLLKGAGSGAPMTAVTAPTGVVVGDTDTQTLTNKRNQRRVVTVATSATPTWAVTTADQIEMLTLTNNITGVTVSGTPLHAEPLTVVLKSAATQTIALGTSFQNGPGSIITATVAGKYHEMVFKYNSVVGKYICMASDAVGY